MKENRNPFLSRRPKRSLKNVIVVLPAYNAEITLEATVEDIPRDVVKEIILVDDCSTDSTVEIARRLGLTVIVHERNTGYGGNQKTCYDEALKRGADAVVMLHPDFQYDSRLIPYFIGFLEMGICDVIVGNRIRTRRETLECGMPKYKYISNRFLTVLENIALGQNLGDFHSGFRVYTREVLETLPYHDNSNDFLFDAQFLIQTTYFGFKMADAPIPVRYFREASTMKFLSSLIYGFGVFGELAKFAMASLGLYRSKIFRSHKR